MINGLKVKAGEKTFSLKLHQTSSYHQVWTKLLLIPSPFQQKHSRKDNIWMSTSNDTFAEFQTSFIVCKYLNKLRDIPNTNSWLKSYVASSSSSPQAFCFHFEPETQKYFVTPTESIDWWTEAVYCCIGSSIRHANFVINRLQYTNLDCLRSMNTRWTSVGKK